MLWPHQPKTSHFIWLLSDFGSRIGLWIKFILFALFTICLCLIPHPHQQVSVKSLCTKRSVEPAKSENSIVHLKRMLQKYSLVPQDHKITSHITIFFLCNASRFFKVGGVTEISIRFWVLIIHIISFVLWNLLKTRCSIQGRTCSPFSLWLRPSRGIILLCVFALFPLTFFIPALADL